MRQNEMTLHGSHSSGEFDSVLHEAAFLMDEAVPGALYATCCAARRSQCAHPS